MHFFSFRGSFILAFDSPIYFSSVSIYFRFYFESPRYVVLFAHSVLFVEDLLIICVLSDLSQFH